MTALGMRVSLILNLERDVQTIVHVLEERVTIITDFILFVVDSVVHRDSWQSHARLQHMESLVQEMF